MEEPIWITIGIISILITFAIFFSLFQAHQEEQEQKRIQTSLEKLQIQCDFVCSTTKGNRLGIDVTLPSPSFLYTSGEKFCISTDEGIACNRCSCELEPYEFNLSGALAEQFDSHDYTCYFEKEKQTVSIDCQA